MDKWFHSTYNNGCNYISMMGLKLIHVRKGGFWYSVPSPNCIITWQLFSKIIQHWYQGMNESLHLHGMVWCNYSSKQWHLITHPCPNLICSLVWRQAKASRGQKLSGTWFVESLHNDNHNNQTMNNLENSLPHPWWPQPHKASMIDNSTSTFPAMPSAIDNILYWQWTTFHSWHKILSCKFQVLFSCIIKQCWN